MSKKRWSFDRRAMIYQDGRSDDHYLIREDSGVREVKKDELPQYIADFIGDADRVSIKLKRYKRRQMG